MMRAIRNLTVALSLLCWLPSAATATPILSFTISPSITLATNVDVLIPAAITNVGTASIDFGCARTPCGGPDFGVGISAGPNEGLNALQVRILNSAGTGFYEQFVELQLDPGESFNFLFAVFNFDPSITIGNPLGTLLHPTFSFRFEDYFARVPALVAAGVETAFAPSVTVPVSERPTV